MKEDCYKKNKINTPVLCPCLVPHDEGGGFTINPKSFRRCRSTDEARRQPRSWLGGQGDPVGKGKKLECPQRLRWPARLYAQ